MYPSTDKNTMSDLWSYLQKKIIFIVSILFLKHELLRLCRKTTARYSSVLYAAWYSLGIIRNSISIRTHLLGIRTVVTFYNHRLWLPYVCIAMQYSPLWVLLQ